MGSSHGLLRCDVVWLCDRIPTFRRILLPLSSGWRWRKRWYPTRSLHGVTIRMTTKWIFIKPQISQLSKKRGCIQKFHDWVDNETNNNKHSLRSKPKGYGGNTRYTDS